MAHRRPRARVQQQDGRVRLNGHAHAPGALESIERTKALAPEVVISGHKVPSLTDDPVVLDDIAAYLRKFDELLVQNANADALFEAMKQAYPDLAGDIILQIATQAAYPSGS